MVQTESSNQSRDDQVIFVSIGVVLVIVISTLVIYGIGFAQSQRAASYQNKIEGVEQELVGLSGVEEQALALGVQEGKLDFLYGTQTKWSGMISDLGKKCLKGVRFSQVSVDRKEAQATIDGTANSFLALNQQVVALQSSDFFDKIDLASATVDGKGGVQFSLTAGIKK